MAQLYLEVLHMFKAVLSLEDNVVLQLVLVGSHNHYSHLGGDGLCLISVYFSLLRRYKI